MKVHLEIIALATLLSTAICTPSHHIPSMTIHPYELANCEQHEGPKNGTPMPYATCVDFPMAKSYRVVQTGLHARSPFCQLGIYTGAGCQTDFKPNFSLKGKKTACFDILLPNGWLGGGNGPSWSAFYICDV